MSDPEKAVTSRIDPDLFAGLNALPPQDENGVDLSLIDHMLDLSPAERIEWNYRSRLFLEKVRTASDERWTR